ncbi:MAG: hypothetical protein E7662_12590 [Ruminococcaceae bacterium]|nr:hypothetical protein [Oscillospiraceae bacterium]
MYGYFPAEMITPRGWLRSQLAIEAKGLFGNLDKVWPDVRDSKWIGGDKEGWERVPYWLDGFIPLAWLLNDEDMKARARRYVEAILDRQCEDGWICPCNEEARSSYDVWAFFLIGKVLTVYYECTGETRAIAALERSMSCLHRLMKNGTVKLARWGKARWFECMIPLAFLYERHPRTWIKELAQMLREQGLDYASVTESWKRPLNKWTFETHIVNMGMMIKYEAVTAQLLGEEIHGLADTLWEILETYNGTVVGTFTGDECLSGLDANRGTELCSVVELMYSCEILYAITGDNVWMERLERLAFNALPATISDDMWTHQYDQMVNQIACVRFPGKAFFRTNREEAHLFGLEPHYGCCTANFGQGWPKLAWSIYRRTEDGIAVGMMLPSELKTRIGDAAVTLSVDTEYPFRHSGTYTVTTSQPVSFALTIRIPAWAKNVRVNGQPFAGENYVLQQQWEGTSEIRVEFSDVPHFVARPHDLRAVEYGALVYALPIEAEYIMLEYVKKDVERKFPYCDYELYPKSPWQFGFASPSLRVSEEQGDEIPFSSKAPRVTLQAQLAPIAWGMADGYDSVADAAPGSRTELAESCSMTLYPYGCTRLRMTEMPMSEKV